MDLWTLVQIGVECPNMRWVVDKDRVFKNYNRMNLQILRIDRTTKWLVGVMGVTFLFLLCSAGIAYVPFELWTHGNIDHSIAWLLKFYQRGEFGISTLIWYTLVLLLTWFGWSLTTGVTSELVRVLLRVGLLTTLLPPAIFINPAPEFIGAIVHPRVYANPETRFLILPAIVCTVKYFFMPSNRWIPSVIALSFWPILATWFATLFVIVIHRLWLIESKLNLSQTDPAF